MAISKLFAFKYFQKSSWAKAAVPFFFRHPGNTVNTHSHHLATNQLLNQFCDKSGSFWVNLKFSKLLVGRGVFLGVGGWGESKL